MKKTKNKKIYGDFGSKSGSDSWAGFRSGSKSWAEARSGSNYLAWTWCWNVVRTKSCFSTVSGSNFWCTNSNSGS